jgi:hypothetical protein
MSERREHAQRYRSMNMEPMPVLAGSKKPEKSKWQNGGFGIDAFNGGGNIGLLTGEIGHGLVCVDLDCEEAIELAPKYLPDTLAVVGRTTRPGCHWFYRCSQPGKKLAFKDPTTGGVVVEVLASGQQVVVGPSTHPDGGVYEPVTQDPAAIDRADLDRAVRQLNNAVLEKRGHVVSADNTADEVAHPTGNTAEGLRPGDDYSERGHDHFRNTLERNGWKHTQKTADGNEHWERPGKDKEETSATFKDGVFYVFSSNAQGFDPEHGYSMFHSYAILEHGGDHSAAARELAEQGYGKPKPNPSESNPFPIDALPPIWGDWMRTTADVKSIPVEMYALPAMAAAASAISHAVVAHPWDDWHAPAIIWPVVIAPSGSMKTSPFKDATIGARDQQRRLDTEYREAFERYECECREWKVKEKMLSKPENRENRGELPPEPRRPKPETCLLGNTTTEALLQVAAESSCGQLVAKSELSGWLDSMGAYKSGKGASGDDAEWNEAYDGGESRINRKTSPPLVIPRFMACVTGTIQPKIWEAAATHRNRESGLLPRFLPALVNPPPPYWNGETTPPHLKEDFRTSFKPLYTISPRQDGSPEVLDFDEGAVEYFQQWHNHYVDLMDSEPDGLYKAALSKLRGTPPRIAIMLTFADWACKPQGMNNPIPKMIGIDAVRRACRIVEWFREQWGKVCATLDSAESGVSDEAMCWGFIMKKGGTTTVRELTHDGPGVMRGRTDAARKWLDRQVDAGLMERCPRPTGPKGGRPTEEYRVCARQDAE